MTASASSARISSMLSVAVTPNGSVPMMSPTSLPALASECTQQPTSSRSGCSRTPLMAATPTPPVAHCTSRRPISSPPGSPRTRTRSTQVYTTRPANGHNSVDIERLDLLEKRTGWRRRAGAEGDTQPPHGLGCQRAHDHTVRQVGQARTRQDADAESRPDDLEYCGHFARFESHVELDAHPPRDRRVHLCAATGRADERLLGQLRVIDLGAIGQPVVRGHSRDHLLF